MFQEIKRVVVKIPKGKVATYDQIAELAGHPGAARQVVWALRSAPGEALPWHRVLGAKGKICLPGHSGAEQRMRLEMEGVRFVGARVKMAECEWKLSRTKKKQVTERSKRRPQGEK